MQFRRPGRAGPVTLICDDRSPPKAVAALSDFGFVVLNAKGMMQMNKKLLLAYLLFFISINAMAAFASVDCNAAFEDVSVHNQQELQCHNHFVEDESLREDKAQNDTFTNLHINDSKQSTSGSLTFILLIPALLVFVFSCF